VKGRTHTACTPAHVKYDFASSQARDDKIIYISAFCPRVPAELNINTAGTDAFILMTADKSHTRAYIIHNTRTAAERIGDKVAAAIFRGRNDNNIMIV